MAHREWAIIESVKLEAYRGGPYDPPDTAWIFLKFGSSGQSFGGLYLKEKEMVDGWVKHFTEAFGVKKYESLVGKECYALRSFDGWNEPIHGLQTLDGHRTVTINTFRESVGIRVEETEIQRRIKVIKSGIERQKRSIEEDEARLKKIGDNYVEWDDLIQS